MKTYNNPLGLHVGERVIAEQVCTVAYDGFDRRLFFDGAAQTCFVVGAIKKALGKYVADFQGCSIEDYDPPYLKVSEYIWLYECRTSITSKPFLVHPDDIKCKREPDD